jgi:methionine-rich copper-binding protein CopC
MEIRNMGRNFRTQLICVVVFLITCQLAFAHAVLVSSSPKVNGTVHGPEVAIDLKFNSHVDAARSRFILVHSDGTTETIALLKQSADDDLSAAVKLPPGKYTLRWQALAVDGHITRGEIPFAVE